jgi:peptidoglycan/xylan/chitin deacetylase (PgdA/CDA1 family)
MMNPLLTAPGFDTWTGRLIRSVRRFRSETCVTILTYHSISHTETVFNSHVRHDPVEFERQMDYLAEKYAPLSLRDLLDRLARNDPPRRGVVVTLDDGYADSIRQAFPIALRRRIPITIFPVTSIVGNRDLLWQHKLAWLVSQGWGPKVIDAFVAEGYPQPIENQDAEEYVRAHYRIDTPVLLESLLNRAGRSGAALAQSHRLYLEPEEIAGADRDFVEFGNHTDTHPILSALNAEQQRVEITIARDILRSLMSYDPIALAYPFGLKRHYDANSVKMARESGHHAALDMRRRPNWPNIGALDLSRKPAPVGSQESFEQMIEDWPDNAEPVPAGGSA